MMNAERPPTDDPAVRRAIVPPVISRDIDTVFNGFGTPVAAITTRAGYDRLAITFLDPEEAGTVSMLMVDDNANGCS
jgi:hypothetical protein